VVHKRQYYRLLTHAFLHADYFHLGINMLVLTFGTSLERIFAGLQQQGLIFSREFFYLCSLFHRRLSASRLVAATATIQYSSLGASGGGLGVVFAYIFFAPAEIYFYMVLPSRHCLQDPLPGLLELHDPPQRTTSTTPPTSGAVVASSSPAAGAPPPERFHQQPG
jgi:membrane associated rhomboid family serine protease